MNRLKPSPGRIVGSLGLFGAFTLAVGAASFLQEQGMHKRLCDAATLQDEPTHIAEAPNWQRVAYQYPDDVSCIATHIDWGTHEVIVTNTDASMYKATVRGSGLLYEDKMWVYDGQFSTGANPGDPDNTWTTMSGFEVKGVKLGFDEIRVEAMNTQI